MVEVRQGAGGEETRRGEEKRGEEEEEKEEDEEEEDEEEATDIKSNNPHLAGGEQLQPFQENILETHLRQTFANLLEHTPTQGTVLIQLKPPEERNRSQTLTFCKHLVKRLCNKKLATKNQENA